jgi:DNA polymerase/3'-5' exonuclease PolX
MVLHDEVTSKNAMSFSKGKTKLPNIGKGSAEKMKEFCETGKIEKLEEKRRLLA